MIYLIVLFYKLYKIMYIKRVTCIFHINFSQKSSPILIFRMNIQRSKSFFRIKWVMNLYVNYFVCKSVNLNRILFKKPCRFYKFDTNALHCRVDTTRASLYSRTAILITWMSRTEAFWTQRVVKWTPGGGIRKGWLKVDRFSFTRLASLTSLSHYRPNFFSNVLMSFQIEILFFCYCLIFWKNKVFNSFSTKMYI